MNRVPVLAIDAGNTRIKWGLRVGEEWVAKGALATADAAKLGRDWPVAPPGTRALGSNVGGYAVQTFLLPGLRTPRPGAPISAPGASSSA